MARMDLPSIAALRSFPIEGEGCPCAVHVDAVEGYVANRAERVIAYGNAAPAKDIRADDDDVGGGAEDAGVHDDRVAGHANPQAGDFRSYHVAQQKSGGGSGIFR